MVEEIRGYQRLKCSQKGEPMEETETEYPCDFQERKNKLLNTLGEPLKSLMDISYNYGDKEIPSSEDLLYLYRNIELHDKKLFDVIQERIKDEEKTMEQLLHEMKNV